MVKFEIGNEVLKEGSLFRIAEYKLDGESKTVTIGRTIRSTFLYHAPGRDAIMAVYNRGINIFEDWQKERLVAFANKEKTKIYFEVDKKYCVDEAKKAFEMAVYAEKTSEEDWLLTFSNEPPVHVMGYALAFIGAIQLDLFHDKVKDYDKSERDNHPAFFCDAIQSGYCRFNSFVGTVTSADDVAEKFALADMSSLFETSYEAEEVEEEAMDEEESEYWTWKSCLNGEHRIDYDWAPEAVPFIPSIDVLKKCEPTEELISILALVEYNIGIILGRIKEGKTSLEALGENGINLKLAGSPGSGKSFQLMCVAAILGMPFWVTSFNPNSDESFAEGKTRMVGSEPRHTDSPLTMCQMYGGISAGEEPNTADPEMVFGVYSQIVESPFTLYRNGCEAVVRHPLSIYTILYNKNCGSATMHAALLNRFNQPFEIQKADKKGFVKMLMRRIDDKSKVSTEVDEFYKEFAKRRRIHRSNKSVCEWVTKAYNCVMNGLDGSSGRDAAEAISLRSCFGVLSAIEAGEDPMSALRCLTDNIGDFDEELRISVEKALHDTIRKL